MKIKIHKESSGQCPCLSPFPTAANDQTIASHRERYREKQTGHTWSRPGSGLLTPMLTRMWQELEYRIDVCRVTSGAHIEHL